MLSKIVYSICLFLAAIFVATGSAMAASDAPFPKDWQTWPVTHSGTILGKQAEIPANLPPIVKETMKTYNWVNDGKGSAYNVRIDPKDKAAASARKGKFDDGDTAVLELVDIKVLLVTAHLLGEAQYGVYTYDGKEISAAHPSLAPQVCNTCHTGYGEACITGVCSK
jgi:hypothetical protein